MIPILLNNEASATLNPLVSFCAGLFDNLLYSSITYIAYIIIPQVIQCTSTVKRKIQPYSRHCYRHELKQLYSLASFIILVKTTQSDLTQNNMYWELGSSLYIVTVCVNHTLKEEIGGNVCRGNIDAYNNT